MTDPQFKELDPILRPFETRADLIARILDQEIIDNFKGPSLLEKRGFKPEGIQSSWSKSIPDETDTKGQPLLLTVDYYPGSQKWVRVPEIDSEAGDTITRFSSTVENKNPGTIDNQQKTRKTSCYHVKRTRRPI
ncbi:hypothetical protein HY409_01130 [Candidatus Gottesmanbacteria bacterium]|nr:hypothetical protein [Candidatus Gottesmanbacteria bacterium]